MNNNDRDLISTDVQLTTNLSHNDLTSINRHLSTTFYSKDSALGLSDEHIHQNVNNDSIKPNETSKDSIIFRISSYTIIKIYLNNVHPLFFVLFSFFKSIQCY